MLRPTKVTNIAKRTSIHDRSKEADSTRFRYWEMDTIIDLYGHTILALSEHPTNFILIEKPLEGRRSTAKTVIKLLFQYRDCIKTITIDDGWLCVRCSS